MQLDRPEKNHERSARLGCSSLNLIGLMIVMALLASLLNNFTLGGNAETEITYSGFRQQLSAANVDNVTFKGETITGQLKAPAQHVVANGDPITYTHFITYLPPVDDPELLALLEDHAVEINTRPADSPAVWPVLLSLFLPVLFIGGLFYLFSRQMRAQGQGIFSMLQSRAKRYERRTEKTTFNDVAGADNVKNELQEIVTFLKNPGKLHQLGAKSPKGILLVGPPGTGKTLLARAVAGEAEVPFFSITGSDFMEMFVGVGASRVRDMFSQAKKVAPSIIFIDELDSIGRRRGAGLGGGHDEREQTLNQLLSELDGFEPTENVVVMAATNRPDILDPALLRPGRFDRRVTVDLPTFKDRVEILKIHARSKPLGPDADLENLARGTPGFSGADLENILNEAALRAARKNKTVIEHEDIEQARDRILLGLRRENMILTRDENRQIAYHEAGHAVVAAVLPHADPIHKVTIVPRGRAMGVTQQMPDREKYIYAREYMLDRLAVMMGGRAAEELALNTVTSGAENDLKQATQLARKMVLDWGFSERLGPVAWSDEREEVFLGEELGRRREYGEATAREIDQEMRAILAEAYSRARDTLKDQRTALDRVAAALLEQEELSGESVLTIVGGAAKEMKQPLTSDGQEREDVPVMSRFRRSDGRKDNVP